MWDYGTGTYTNNSSSPFTVATPTKYTGRDLFNMYHSGDNAQKQQVFNYLYSSNEFGNDEFSEYLSTNSDFNQDYANYTQQQLEKNNNSSSSMSGMDIANGVFKGLSSLTSAGTSIANAALGWANYSKNKELINKQIDAINEQISASQEYRQQRRDEITRLNRVRSNTQKSFNTGTTITRSY